MWVHGVLRGALGHVGCPGPRGVCWALRGALGHVGCPGFLEVRWVPWHVLSVPGVWSLLHGGADKRCREKLSAT